MNACVRRSGRAFQTQPLALALVLALVLTLGLASVWNQTAQAAMNPVIIGEDVDIAGFDPALNESPWAFRPLVYNTLVELDLDFKITPGLATHWEASPDGLTWTFFLRPDVVFHDGSPLTAEVVKMNFERLREGAQKSWLSGIEEISVPDEATVVFRMNAPTFIFDSHLTPPFLSIVGPAAVDDQGKVIAAIGTGPFTVESWQKGRECVLRANPSYWGGKPRIDQVIFRIIRDPDARVMAFESGDVNLVSLRGALTAVQRLEKNESFTILKRTGQTSENIYLNTRRPLLSDPLVRRALAKALDLETMIPELLGETAEPGRTFFASGFGAFVSPTPYMPRFDLDQAKTLLAEAGWKAGPRGVMEKDGSPMKLSLTVVANNAENMLLAAAIQHALKAVGCEVVLNPVESAAITEQFRNGNYDLLMLGQWLIPHNEPFTHYRFGYYHDNSTYKVYTSPEITALIDELETTADRERRLDLHHGIQDGLGLAMPAWVLFHRNNIIAVPRDFADFTVSVGTWQLYRDLAKP
ncbi:ABC transporter substrate-binding protein [Desulfonatronum parangueonense]